MANQIIIAGAGWLGRPLALALKDKHNEVTVLSRDDEQVEYFKEQHILVTKVNYLQIEPLAEHSKQHKTLIVCIPPVANYGVILVELLKAIRPNYVIFSSSTSVYSQPDGEVNEASMLGGNPLLQEAESLIIHSEVPNCILRFGGLIGEDRNPASHFSGKHNIPNGGAPVNLIHRNEIIEIISQVIESRLTGVYNVVYPSHPTRKEYYEKQCIQRGLLPCTFDSEGNGKIVNGSKISALLNRPYRFSID